MQLKKIILHGFKSFADRTEFAFEPGATVIVGPNGCGKSNVVDAVKWVLGEQSAKSLRGGQMLDVIFNGSTTRKSLGMAEVTLSFANTRGLLPTDLDEVSVTRKLYRSGESEYLMNGQSCRLKDIREMFMDTGVGADAYSIIEQGKVDVLLQSTKQDRRAIFEEAAGISKYKARKREALRKLERTEQNLLRLTDLIGELEKRLRSIKLQAGKARSYQQYSARLKELRLNQFLAEYHQLRQEAEAIEHELAVSQESLAGLTATIQQGQNRLSVLDGELDGTICEIRQHENQQLECTSQIGAQQDRIDWGQKRCKELEETAARAREQMRSIRQRIGQYGAQIAADEEQLRQCDGQIAEQRQKLEELQEVRQHHTLELGEYQARLEDEKSGLIDIVRRTAQFHNAIQSLEHHRDNLAGQKDRLNDRSGKIMSQIEELATDRAAYDQKLRQVTELLNESKKQLEHKKEQFDGLNQRYGEMRESLSAAKENRSGLVSRQELLADLESRLEGVDQGVRQILQAKGADGEAYYYIRAMVAEVIRAEVKYASLVESALSGRAQDLVASSSQAVAEDQANLEQLKGRVNIICMDQLPAFCDGYDFSQHPEVRARLIDTVSYAPENERLAWHLLGKTVLVDTIDSALRLSQVVPPGYRFVTLGGEVLEPDGTLRLGPNTGQVGLISRKSELREITKNLEEVDERIKHLQQVGEQNRSQASHVEKSLQELRTAIYENNTEEIETRGRLEQIDGNLTRLNEEQPLIATETAMLEQQIEESVRRRLATQQDLESLEATNNQRQEKIDSLERQIEAMRTSGQSIQEKITELKVQAGQNQQRRMSLEEKISATKSRLQQDQHAISQHQAELTRAQEENQSTERAILSAESKISQLFQTRQQSQSQAQTLRDLRDGLLAEKQQLADQLREQNEQKDHLQQAVYDIQMRGNEHRLRSENLCERAQNELSLDMTARYADYVYQQMDWEAMAGEVEDLRGKIERLGNVNLDAIVEQEELEGRSEVLGRQASDLSDSKRELEQLIAKIDKQSEEVFLKNFEAIRGHFGELYRKLFGGGRADIILEDPEHMLDCGIEIIARPPGKQPQSISLLSGGEKTLTAVALLMAIFKSKPSPFCLLDEVDAALDEANNERFNLVVQDFLQESQFVIITHSRRTMSIGDMLYGITMQEQGVSKKVSVKFSQGQGSADTEPQPDSAVA